MTGCCGFVMSFLVWLEKKMFFTLQISKLRFCGVDRTALCFCLKLTEPLTFSWVGLHIGNAQLSPWLGAAYL